MISIQNLSKSYEDHQALSSINLEVKKDELFGLIGPDGAGKTTLFRILTTLIQQDEGAFSLNDINPETDFKQIRTIIGYMPGRFSLYQDLTVQENLDFFATVFDTSIEENYDLIADIYKQIEPFKHRKAGKLSGGMKQKLALSCALIHKPKILVLDEPTTGVDAVSRMEFWQMLKKLQLKGITIIVSTPYMDEASLCDRVALIQKGEILDVDTPTGIINKFPKKLYAISSNDTYKLLKDLRANKYSDTIYPFGETVHYTTKQDDLDIDDLTQYLSQSGNKNISITPIKADIEDCFMQLMGNPE